MGQCCDPRGCDEFFGGGFARRMAARYRKRGLDRTARRPTARGLQPEFSHRGLVWRIAGLERQNVTTR
jgi:hypothetical protein